MSTRKRYLFASLFGLVPAILVSLLMSGLLRAQEGEQLNDASMIPARPPGHILDLARWFSGVEKEQAEKGLASLYQNQQIDMYLVTRDELPPQGAEFYARKLGKAWSRSPVWCVVFHVPGDPAGFHVEAGIVEMNPELVDQAIAEGSKRARREATEKDRVMAAWRECSEELRFLHAMGKRYNEKRAENWDEMVKEWIADQRRKKILKVVIIGGTFLLVVVTFVVVSLIRKKRVPKAYQFPETSWRKRYQAPHSGGGGIVASYRVSKIEDRR